VKTTVLPNHEQFVNTGLLVVCVDRACNTQALW